MNRGFVILAQNTDEVDYVKCATVLAKSIKQHMPTENVSIITDNTVDSDIFDKVIPLPKGDLDKDGKWKLINDYQVYEASPYEYTIKLEADLIITRDISYWWDVLSYRDLVVSSTIRNFRGEVSQSKFYRKFIIDNKLPDVYNAITYFKKSKTSEEFFLLVQNIFDNWKDYKRMLRCDPDEVATTDWVYAISCHLMGVDKTTLPTFSDMSMTHMKKHINGLLQDDWTRELIVELVPETIRINGFPQQYPLHYHVKDFTNVLEKYYG